MVSHSSNWKNRHEKAICKVYEKQYFSQRLAPAIKKCQTTFSFRVISSSSLRNNFLYSHIQQKICCVKGMMKLTLRFFLEYLNYLNSTKQPGLPIAMRFRFRASGVYIPPLFQHHGFQRNRALSPCDNLRLDSDFTSTILFHFEPLKHCFI